MIKIIPIFHRAREIKPDGADIEEVLECYTVEEVKQIIEGLGDEKSNILDSNSGSGDLLADSNADAPSSDRRLDHGYPFEILGIADDGRAYFIDSSDRMANYRTTELNSNILSDLGTYEWFKNNSFGGADPTVKDWASEIDSIRILSKRKDFDLEKIKGRGGWRTKNGGLCYFDGKNITGVPDDDWKFVRKPLKKIGINQSEAPAGVRADVMKISKRFTLKTPADNIRLLSWAVLAPFAGCLVWRPMILSTGESGWGKTTVMDYVVAPIANYIRVNGTSTTEAAIRQYNGIDSYPIYVEEAEAKNKNPKDKERIEGIFALGRGSSTDDAPKTIKGSPNGNATVYEMKSMFSFTAINASIDDSANDNRIIKINFKPPTNKESFVDDVQEIKTLLDKKTCDGIRAFTWHHLPQIIKLGERLFSIIQKVTGQDARFAAGESILLAANAVVWEDMTFKLGDTDLTSYVTDFYKNQAIEEKRDETDEMVQSLLDETIIFGNNKTPRSLRELLIAIKKHLDQALYFKNGDHDKIDQVNYTIKAEEYIEHKRAVEQCGLTVHGPTRELAIAHPHKWIMRTLGVSQGYYRQLKRHKRVMEYKGSDYPTMTIDSGTKRAVIIGGCLDYNSPADTDAQDDRSF